MDAGRSNHLSKIDIKFESKYKALKVLKPF